MLFASTNAFGVGDAAKVVAGLVDGIIKSDDLTLIEKCLTNAGSLTTDISAAVADFETESFEGILSGMKTIGKIVKEIPSDLSTCENIEDDIRKLELWASIFEHPEELMTKVAENIFEHYSEITGDVHTAMADWTSEDYFGFGNEIANAVVTAVGTSAPSADALRGCGPPECPWNIKTEQ